MPCMHSTHAGIRVVMPCPVRAPRRQAAPVVVEDEVWESSEHESNHDDDASADSDDEDQEAHAESDGEVEMPVEPRVPRVVVPAVGRHLTAFPFGRWSISCLNPGGVFSGYGANCLKHSNRGRRVRCQKAFRFVYNTPEETLALAKQWLLLGLDIPEDSFSGQMDHVHGIDRSEIELRPAADLDHDAETALALYGP